MALFHSRLGLENKAGRIFCVRQVYLGRVNQPFIPFIHHIWGEQYYLSPRPRTECSISQFFKTNCIHSIFRTINRRLLAKPSSCGRVFEWTLIAELWRAKRACGAPWVSKSTHPRKFGNHVTDRPSNWPSVRTTVIPMFTLTLSSYFGSPGESWLHINVVINWHLSKQGIRWPVSPDRIAGSGVDPSRSSIFEVIRWQFTRFQMIAGSRLLFVLNSCQICCVYVSTITILISNWPQTQRFSQFFFKYRRGRPFLTMVTCCSRSTSNFYALIG